MCTWKTPLAHCRLHGGWSRTGSRRSQELFLSGPSRIVIQIGVRILPLYLANTITTPLMNETEGKKMKNGQKWSKKVNKVE